MSRNIQPEKRQKQCEYHNSRSKSAGKEIKTDFIFRQLLTGSKKSTINQNSWLGRNSVFHYNQN